MPTIIALILCSFLIDFILKRRNLLSLFSFVSVFYSFRNIKQLLIAFVCNNLAAMHLKFFRLPPPSNQKTTLSFCSNHYHHHHHHHCLLFRHTVFLSDLCIPSPTPLANIWPGVLSTKIHLLLISVWIL